MTRPRVGARRGRPSKVPESPPTNGQVPVASEPDLPIDGEAVVAVEAVEADGSGAEETLKAKVTRWATSGASEGGKAPSGGTTKASDLAAGVIVPILALAMLAVPLHLRMTESEQSAAAAPLARILIRRVTVLRKLSPDLVDGFAVMAVMTGYARRVQLEGVQRAAAFLQQQMAGGRPHPAGAPAPPQRSPNGNQPAAVDLGTRSADSAFGQYLGRAP